MYNAHLIFLTFAYGDGPVLVVESLHLREDHPIHQYGHDVIQKHTFESGLQKVAVGVGGQQTGEEGTSEGKEERRGAEEQGRGGEEQRGRGAEERGRGEEQRTEVGSVTRK
jgi:hypothetical protein